MTVLITGLLSGVANDGTGHAVAAASSAAELGAGDRPHLNPRAFARHLGADDQPGRAGGEEVAGEEADGAGRRPFALPDEDDAVARRHDVAALDRRAAPVVVGASEPDLEVCALEPRVEAVDGLD